MRVRVEIVREADDEFDQLERLIHALVLVGREVGLEQAMSIKVVDAPAEPSSS